VAIPLAGRKARASDFVVAYAHVYQVTGQSINNQTDTAVTFTGEILDTANGHSSVSNTSRYTPTIPGYYRCHGEIAWAMVADATFRACHFRKNGARADGGPHDTETNQNTATLVNTVTKCEATYAMNGSTDYIEIWGWHNRGSALSTLYTANVTNSFMIIEWKAPL
jgi:hypothetical protein